MSTHTDAWTLRAMNQHRCVPTIELTDAFLNRFITWI
jgi:hypothetical protein